MNPIIRVKSRKRKPRQCLDKDVQRKERFMDDCKVIKGSKYLWTYVFKHKLFPDNSSFDCRLLISD